MSRLGDRIIALLTNVRRCLQLKGTSINCPRPDRIVDLRDGATKAAIMAQTDFFELSDRYASLDAKNAPLVKINEIVP